MGRKSYSLDRENKSSIVVSSSSRSGQQKTITKIIGFQATIYRVSSSRFSCRSMRKSSSSVRWFWCSFSSCRVCKAWNSESKSKLVVTVVSGCKFVMIETLQLQNYRILSFWFSCRRQPQHSCFRVSSLSLFVKEATQYWVTAGGIKWGS